MKKEQSHRKGVSQSDVSYESASVRISHYVDFNKVTNISEFKQELARAGREDKSLLNFFGKSRGERNSGVERLYNSNYTQSKISKTYNHKEQPEQSRKVYKSKSGEIQSGSKKNAKIERDKNRGVKGVKKK